VPSVFIRLAGCPIRCTWCDTPYAWDPQAGTDLDIEAIVGQMERWSSRFAVITGGEPMVTADLRPRPGLVELTCRLKAGGYHVTIETAGVAFVRDLVCDLMSISPKLDRFDPRPGASCVEVMRGLIAQYDYQLKFVIESPTDAEKVKGILDLIGGVDPVKVLLMPQAQTHEDLAARSPAVAQMCLDNGWVFCQRLHVLLWGSQPGR